MTFMNSARTALYVFILSSQSAFGATEPTLAAEGCSATWANGMWSQIRSSTYGMHEQQERGDGVSNAQLRAVSELVLQFYENCPGDTRTAELRRALFLEKTVDPVSSLFHIVRHVDYLDRLSKSGFLDLDAHTQELMRIAQDPDMDIYLKFHKLRYAIRLGRPGIERERNIYATLRTTHNAKLRDLAEGRERFLKLYEQPFDLSLPTLTNGTINLKELRGRVVLLDMWSVSCTSCIAMMPNIQYLYSKYRDAGFEVVGVLFIGGGMFSKPDANKDRTDAARILKEQGAEWPEGVINAEEGDARYLHKEYSMNGVPQMWLLDQSGKLVLDVGIEDFRSARAGQSRIELKIRELLGLK